MYASFNRATVWKGPFPVSPSETFGQYIKRHRILADMKQDALAKRAKISQSYVSGIERGVNVEIDPPVAAALADALGLPRNEVLQKLAGSTGYDFELTRIPDDAAFLVEAYQGATPQNKEMLRRMAQLVREVDSEHSVGGKKPRKNDE